jgi:hypothetical protein
MVSDVLFHHKPCGDISVSPLNSSSISLNLMVFYEFLIYFITFVAEAHIKVIGVQPLRFGSSSTTLTEIWNILEAIHGIWP